MKKWLIVLIVVLLGSGFGGCVRGLVDRGVGVAEDRLEVIKGEQYDEMALFLKANGGDISRIDTDGDGEIQPREIISAIAKNPTAAWWWSEAFWLQFGSLAAATFGWRGLRRFRNGNKRPPELPDLGSVPPLEKK